MLAAFQERIRDAAGRGTPLCLRGGGSKDFYGGALAGEVLDTRGQGCQPQRKWRPCLRRSPRW